MSEFTFRQNNDDEYSKILNKRRSSCKSISKGINPIIKDELIEKISHLYFEHKAEVENENSKELKENINKNDDGEDEILKNINQSEFKIDKADIRPKKELLLNDNLNKITKNKNERYTIGEIELNCESFLYQNKRKTETIQPSLFPRITSIENNDVIFKSSGGVVEKKTIVTSSFKERKSSTRKSNLKRNQKLSKAKSFRNWRNTNQIKQPTKIVINLEDANKYDDTQIPAFIVFCTQTLRNKNLLNTKGIYRESPSFDEAQLLLQKACKCNLEDIEIIDNAILLSGGMKGFFKAMEIPLLFSDKFNSYFNRDRIDVKKFDHETLQICQDMISDLPKTTQEIFLFIILHLNDIAKYQDENLMNISNLARVWSPCLFSDEFIDNLDLLNLLSNQSNLLQNIIENYQDIFNNDIRSKIGFIYNPNCEEIIEIQPRRPSIFHAIFGKSAKLIDTEFRKKYPNEFKRNSGQSYTQMSSTELDDDDEDRRGIRGQGGFNNNGKIDENLPKNNHNKNNKRNVTILDLNDPTTSDPTINDDNKKVVYQQNNKYNECCCIL